ncbi:MAG: hypothetical protein P9M08_02740 [Candidatus Erginobacter occultus]|nr:hypothetical protein [Candidatus Erginobacter occultus]
MIRKIYQKYFFHIADAGLRAALAILLIITIFRGVLYILFIPPWQSPDEPTHFEYVKILAEGGNPFCPRPDLELQKRIILSMDRFRYWQLVDVDVPDPLPDNFRRTPFLYRAASQLQKNPPFYYITAALFLRLGSERSILSEMYRLRILSLMFTLLTVIVVFFAAREFEPEQPLLALVCPGSLQKHLVEVWMAQVRVAPRSVFRLDDIDRRRRGRCCIDRDKNGAVQGI